jgi:hypothetical protein
MLRTCGSAVSRLVDQAGKLGVAVRENANMQDLAGLFGSRRVVTIVAHWRGPQISRRDLQIEAAVILNRMSQASGEVVHRLICGLPADWSTRLNSTQSEQERCSRLAELLDARMCRLPALASPPAGTEWHADAVTLRHMNRVALEQLWPDAIKAGNRLELADGLHSADALGAIVPEKWEGIADFSNCQSAQLIDKIKQYRSDRIVIANEGETNPVRRMELLRVVYDLLSKNQTDYASVREAMAAGMRRIGR